MSHPAPWASRLETPYLLTVRPVRGTDGLALLITNGRETARGVVANLVTGARIDLPFPIGVEDALTPDGRYVLQLDDGGGSEVGHVHAHPVQGGAAVDLTPGMPPYVVRGIDISADGHTAMFSTVDDDGFHLVAVPLTESFGPARRLFSTKHEAWWGRISADGRYASFDTTDHQPGIRRTAVTVIDTTTSATVAVLDDLPDGPVRARCFSEVPADPRLLVVTERTGFARPALWNPLTGERIDFALPELAGEVVPLDWHAGSGAILAVHVADGVHNVIRIDERSGGYAQVVTAPGSYFEPDVASTYPFIWNSFLLSDGSAVLANSRWHVPLSLTRARDGVDEVLEPAAPVPPGRPLTSERLTSRDSTPLQLWVGRPDLDTPRGTILDVHGGPNLVTVDGYSPSAQSWLDEGYVYASLNYRGSVTFGQHFREGFWGALGERELDDVAAALAWLTERGMARPETTFMTGASYGGFLTLFSLGRLPHLFAGGFAHVAMADWAAAFAEQNPAQRDVWRQWVGGDPADFDARVERYSPLTYVKDVTASVWLNQGSLDTRTPATQAQVYADALTAAGGDAVLEWFDGGHEPTGLNGLLHDQERMSELARLALQGRRWSDGIGGSS